MTGSAPINAALTSELRMLADIRRRKGEAFDAFFDRHGPRLYRLARHLAGNEPDGEEVALRALRAAVDPATAGPKEERLEPWLCGLVVQAAYVLLTAKRAGRKDKQRPAQRREEGLDAGLDFDTDDRLGAAPDDWSEWIGDAPRREELRAALLEAARRIPESLRAVWLLADVEGLTLHDVSEALDLSPPHARTCIHRARLLLRREMGRALADRQRNSSPGDAPRRRR